MDDREIIQWDKRLTDQARRGWDNYKHLRLDLGVARLDQSYLIAGEYLYAENSSSADALAKIKLNRTNNESLDLLAGVKIETIFIEIFVTNDALEGEWLDLVFGINFKYEILGQLTGEIGNGGGGTEYTEGEVDATLTGPVILAEGPANTVTPVLVDASGHVQIDILSGGGGPVLNNVEHQVTWATASIKTILAGNNATSDMFPIPSTASFGHIQLKADNAGTPAAGDTVDFFLLLTCGDPDGALADEYDTVGHALPLGTLDTDSEDPALRTVNCPIVKAGKLYAVNNSAGRSIIVSACLLFKSVTR